MDGAVDDLENSPNPYLELLNAAYTGNLDRFKRLAVYHAKGEGITVAKWIGKAKNDKGSGSLHAAAKGGSLNVCEYLLDTLKFDVDAKDYYAITPLYHAIFEGGLDTVRYLLEKGANADSLEDEVFPPLHSAARIGDTKMITLLLSRGARVDVATREGTALREAACNGQRDAVKVLLAHGANPNLVTRECMHRPLISAISVKSWECVELLLQAGADPNAVPHGHSSPLALVAEYGRVDVIKRLLEAGADPNYKTNPGLTALEIAAFYGNYQSVGVLFPVTSRIPTYHDWSIAGLMRIVKSDTNNMQREAYAKEKFHQAKSKGRDAFQGEQYLMAVDWFKEALTISPKDPAVLSNISACYARLGDGVCALDYATKCTYESPEWPKAFYRLGVALNIQERFDDAAAAFKKGLTLDPRNKELKDAYMKAIEATLNAYQRLMQI